MHTTPVRYEFRDVPPTGTSKTRFMLSHGPGGATSEPVNIVTLALNVLGLERRAATPSVIPATTTVPLKRVGIDVATGEYVLVDRGSLSRVPTREAVRSGKFVKLDVSGAALLDEVFVGGPAYTMARDEQIWDALRQLAEDVKAEGRTLRLLSDEVACLVALRAGIEVTASGLPN